MKFRFLFYVNANKYRCNQNSCTCMSIIKSIVTSDFFVLVVIPIAIVASVLYVCKKYGFSLIPKSLKKSKKNKKKFNLPNISRVPIDKKLGHAGKYMWSVADDSNLDNSKDQDSRGHD